MSPRRLALVSAAAIAGALPATTALASDGADDGPATTTRTTTTTTTSPAPASARSTRARAVAAAKAAVGEQTRVLRVRAKSGRRWEVRLAGDTTRYTVRLDRDLDVLRVRREALRPADTGSDDGTADQGSGDAPASTTTGTTTTPASSGSDDGTPDQGSGDAPGTAPSGGGSDDSGHHGGGSDDDGGHHGGHGSDD